MIASVRFYDSGEKIYRGQFPDILRIAKRSGDVATMAFAGLSHAYQVAVWRLRNSGFAE
jgi:hypothetical protein